MWNYGCPQGFRDSTSTKYGISLRAVCGLHCYEDTLRKYLPKVTILGNNVDLGVFFCATRIFSAEIQFSNGQYATN